MHEFVVIFFVDFLIYSKSKEEHAEHLRITLQVLRVNQLYAKYSKCKFRMKEVKFFGHAVSKEVISVDPSKIEAVLERKRSKSVFEI